MKEIDTIDRSFNLVFSCLMCHFCWHQWRIRYQCRLNYLKCKSAQNHFNALMGPILFCVIDINVQRHGYKLVSKYLLST